MGHPRSEVDPIFSGNEFPGSKAQAPLKQFPNPPHQPAPVGPFANTSFLSPGQLFLPSPLVGPLWEKVVRVKLEPGEGDKAQSAPLRAIF
jgi:hypothetical protein